MKEFSGFDYLLIDAANQYGTGSAKPTLYDKLTKQIDKLTKQIEELENHERMQQMPNNEELK